LLSEGDGTVEGPEFAGCARRGRGNSSSVEHGGTHHIDTAVSRNGDDRLKGSEIDT
jgi:hypothetical protein